MSKKYVKKNFVWNTKTRHVNWQKMQSHKSRFIKTLMNLDRE